MTIAFAETTLVRMTFQLTTTTVSTITTTTTGSSGVGWRLV
ncbi:hypothetical protein [Undibacterium sp. KW1]|nr:hypothetical protein [Undibacterium sp. KW1]